MITFSEIASRAIRVPIAAVAFVLLSGSLVLATPQPASAAQISETIDGIAYDVDENDIGAGATVVDYDVSFGADVVIPSSVSIANHEYDVTAVGESAFYMAGLLSLDIADSVVSIGDYAFAENHILDLNLPASLTSIGLRGFATSVASGSVIIPASVTSIGTEAFYRNDFYSVELGYGVVTIGDGAFSENKLTDVVLPENVEVIGDWAFGDNSELSSVVFEAMLAPEITAAGTNGSFGEADGKSLQYPYSATGFESPNWRGYAAHSDSHAVSFDTGGGNIVGDAMVEHDRAAGSPAKPIREGYAFTGWYTDADATELYDFNAPVVADVTLYAGWTINSYAVTFDTVEGTSIPAVNVDYGDSLVVPNDPGRDGYTFIGWFADADATIDFDFTAAITGDVTVYAGWERSSVPVEEGDPVGEDDSVVDDGTATDVVETWTVNEQLPTTGGTVPFGTIAVALLSIASGAATLVMLRRRPEKR
ncbi:InlB B-repeat-containing protein [Paramicrobacterium chengjingii]|uniref:InlB B-repeat-containing protein n=1 Tax=Paramicrobacterium chengjingii TaxID=2769067 RepID=A0ABX6YHC4_9MICO|nr:InlB B-repeat-containing protein [Microbacterium chengjingii]QPZ38163.1 InlB B-repeat-containing protein [Microbacterium chengjingii]